MAVFSLIHGAFHDAWSWNGVSRILESKGHRIIAVDLPIDDPQAGLLRHRDVVVRSLKPVAQDDALVVVGHSFGGLIAPLVAEVRPVDVVVFLNSPIPSPGIPLSRQRERDSDMLLGALEPHVSQGADGLRRLLPSAVPVIYRGCPSWVREQAPPRWRGQNPRGMTDPSPMEAWPDTDYRYILSTEDTHVSPDWSRRAARERLSVEPLELPGDHYPMFSCVELLADHLDGIAS